MAQLEHIMLTPTTRRYERPLLLLHGAWHGAWCWADAMRDFAQRGFEVHAISLRHHGASDHAGSINFWSLNHYVNDLRTTVQAISPTPIVIGHSMGGYITQLYLNRWQLPGAVLLASIPVHGTLGFMLRNAQRNPVAMLKSIATFDMRQIVGTPELARQAFLRPDVDPALLQRAFDQLGSESLLVALEAALWLKPDSTKTQTPLLVIAAERDAIFTLDEEHTTANAYNVPLHVIPEAAHDVMLDPAWNHAADLIEEFVAKAER